MPPQAAGHGPPAAVLEADERLPGAPDRGLGCASAGVGLRGAAGPCETPCGSGFSLMRRPRRSLIGVMAPRRHMTKTRTPTGLSWSERGPICCAAHTPDEGTDTWSWERWEPLPSAAVEAADHVLRCETCGTEAHR